MILSEHILEDEKSRRVGTLVIGAGLVGMSTAVACAQENSSTGKATIVLERGLVDSYRDKTSSQGNLRGSRVVDQTMELTQDIRRTWNFIDYLQGKYQTRISERATAALPYLMLVKDRRHLSVMRSDLEKKNSSFQLHTLEDAAQKFGL